MLNLPVPKSEIVGIECKNIAYQEAVDKSGNDMILIKHATHTKDGRVIDGISWIENFQREIYTTKEIYRNHNDKKDYEERSKLDMWKTNDANMSVMVQRALGRQFPNPKLQKRIVCDSPYIYNCDVTATTIIRNTFEEKYGDKIVKSPDKVAVLDIETDVVFGTNEPIMCTITMGDKKITAIADWWAKRIPDCEETIKTKYKEYLNYIDIRDQNTGKMVAHNLLEERGEEMTILYEENIALGIKAAMLEVHKWMPDFVAIWNINFDLPKINAILKKHGVPLEDVWCDPDCPPKYRRVWYKEAKSIRETASKTISQHPADLWHVLYTMAGFYVIDAMAVFKKIRVANGNEPDYNLDGVLHRHLGIGKLRFNQVKAPEGDILWHIEMQRDWPAEYVVYNIFDCVSVELLDEVTNDLRSTFRSLAGLTDYARYPSMPTRLVDYLTFFYKKRGLIAGCVGSGGNNELDEDVIELSGWIVTLPAHMLADDGLKIVKEVPRLVTAFRAQTADDDIAQAYPRGEEIENVSKETTMIEINSIEGVTFIQRRNSGINLTGGRTNAIEICNELFKYPSIHRVADQFARELQERKCA